MSVLLHVKVTPRSSRNAIKVDGDLIRAWVTASATEGQANKAVCELLAKALGVAKSFVRIKRGEAGREKQIEIDGLTLAEARERLR